MKYRFKKNTVTRSKRAKWSILLGTFITLLIAGVIVLVACAIQFKWTWEMIGYWLNPFSEGNNWAWVIYAAVLVFVFILIWLIHQARVEKYMGEDK